MLNRMIGVDTSLEFTVNRTMRVAAPPTITHYQKERVAALCTGTLQFSLTSDQERVAAPPFTTFAFNRLCQGHGSITTEKMMFSNDTIIEARLGSSANAQNWHLYLVFRGD